MPKLSTPSIHFLMKNRPNRRGECPILLVVRFNGRADRATGRFSSQFHRAIEELNSTLGDDEKVPTGMSFYSARHSFATNYVKRSGNLSALASMMGRSPNTIATYINTLTNESDLLAERLKMNSIAKELQS